MASDVATLQKLIVTRLVTHSPLTAMLGGAKIYDRPPEGAALPYVTLGATRVNDAGTASENAGEHLVLLHVWSRKGGRKETADILAEIRTALETVPATLDTMRLVNLVWRGEDIVHDTDVRAYHGTIRHRAVTEAIAL